MLGLWLVGTRAVDGLRLAVSWTFPFPTASDSKAKSGNCCCGCYQKTPWLFVGNGGMDPYDSPLRSPRVVSITHSPHSLLRARKEECCTLYMAATFFAQWKKAANRGFQLLLPEPSGSRVGRCCFWALGGNTLSVSRAYDAVSSSKEPQSKSAALMQLSTIWSSHEHGGKLTIFPKWDGDVLDFLESQRFVEGLSSECAEHFHAGSIVKTRRILAPILPRPIPNCLPDTLPELSWIRCEMTQVGDVFAKW